MLRFRTLLYRLVFLIRYHIYTPASHPSFGTCFDSPQRGQVSFNSATGSTDLIIGSATFVGFFDLAFFEICSFFSLPHLPYLYRLFCNYHTYYLFSPSFSRKGVYICKIITLACKSARFYSSFSIRNQLSFLLIYLPFKCLVFCI